jgi:hypothetical protein
MTALIDVPSVQEKSPPGDPSFVVIDIGKKQRKKAIKRLRKGKGKLTRKIEEMLAELRESSSLPAGSPVVIVVREKKNKKSRRLFADL